MRTGSLCRALALSLLSCGLVSTLWGQTLDGHWTSRGYGYYLHVDGPELKAYEITGISCLESFSATRTDGPSDEGSVGFTMSGTPATFELRAGTSPDERRIHFNGTASDIILERRSSAPAVCERTPEDTPLANFEIFARTWAEQYGFFDLKDADWPSIVATQRKRVTNDTKPEELFEVLKAMIEAFEDAHTSLRAESIDETWFGSRRTAHWLESSERPRAFAIVETSYLQSPIQTWCNGQLELGRLRGGVAYLRLRSFARYGDEPGFQSGYSALVAALDTIFADAETWPGLVIDVRINGGGADPYGLEIASRLATADYVAYSKQARADPEDPTQWTEGQPSWVRPSSRPGFHGPVVELIGIHSVSAAETFTQALMGRTPKVTRVGENTQGVFSDVLGRQLPNGWRFGLPNERFVTDGKSYDGPGIPPDVEVAVFPSSDLEAARDGAIEKALEILGLEPR